MKNSGKTSLFVTGIDTDVGKTIVSAVLMKALEAYYWKPIQCGVLPKTDRQSVAELTGLSSDLFIEETHLLKTPCSPHIAAKIENKKILLEDFILPSVNKNLVIEGAGGCMVPLNGNHTLVDLIKKLDIQTVVVSKNYLGSINHTLMTIKVLQASNIKIGGLIFNGKENTEIESFISNKVDLPILFRLGNLEHINHEIISAEAVRVRKEIFKWI
jgi:dethiobiotin synthetase